MVDDGTYADDGTHARAFAVTGAPDAQLLCHAEMAQHILAGCPEMLPGCPACEALRSSSGGSALRGSELAAAPGSWCSAAVQFAGRGERCPPEPPLAGAEGEAAQQLLTALVRRPPAQQRLLVKNSRRYASSALCRLLLDEAWSLRFEDPATSRERAELAVTVASALDGGALGSLRARGLRSRAWATLGNALRILSDYPGAEEALRRAACELSQGAAEIEDLAWWLDTKASLRSNQLRFAEAELYAARAVALYRCCGDLHSAGRALIKRGMIRGHREDSDGEIAFLKEGLELIDLGQDPHLVPVAWQNLVFALYKVGRNREALAALGRARPLYLQNGNRTTFVRFQWLEGLIATALGRLDQAEGCLREARQQFISLGIAHDAALVSLDLADLLARRGRNDEVCRLAAEMIAIFEALEGQREALAALILFHRAAQRERITGALLRRVAGALRRSGKRAYASHP